MMRIMKKEYQKPHITHISIEITPILVDATNITGDNGIGSGDDDSGGEGDPDSKKRGGSANNSWGSLW